MSQPAQQIRFCTSRDGTRIAYATSGEGLPLVWAANLFHHIELDWQSPVWRPWLATLARRNTLIRYDLRGCGLSDRDTAEFSLEKFVDDLHAVVDAARADRFTLFGVSAGAATAITYAVRNPRRVNGLVLYASFVRNKLAGRPTLAEQAEAQARLKVMELGWPDTNPAYARFYPSLHIPDASPEQFRTFADLARRTTSPANAVGLVRAFFGIDLREIVAHVSSPTLVLHPREDAIVPFEQGRSVAGLIPGARFVPLESRNHVLLDTEPAWRQFVEAMEEFLPALVANPVGHSQFPFGELTARQREVLDLVARGLDNSDIGHRLGISPRTARNHIAIILAKLGISSRAQAIVRGREAGFGAAASGAAGVTQARAP
jgi:pimeloyl-ACP methyl ester carboxylesterase/DNA-binding CsgD family transcriptional regulator